MDSGTIIVTIITAIIAGVASNVLSKELYTSRGKKFILVLISVMLGSCWGASMLISFGMAVFDWATSGLNESVAWKLFVFFYGVCFFTTLLVYEILRNIFLRKAPEEDTNISQ